MVDVSLYIGPSYVHRCLDLAPGKLVDIKLGHDRMCLLYGSIICKGVWFE